MWDLSFYGKFSLLGYNPVYPLKVVGNSGGAYCRFHQHQRLSQRRNQHDPGNEQSHVALKCG
jgi:hypothetical protein